MAQALPLAEAHNVILGVEPEVSNVIDSAERARRLLDEMKSPNLKIVMDGANLFHYGELPCMSELIHAFELLGDDIVIAHAKDLVRVLARLATLQPGRDYSITNVICNSWTLPGVICPSCCTV